jgi:hypothetical protein
MGAEGKIAGADITESARIEAQLSALNREAERPANR